MNSFEKYIIAEEETIFCALNRLNSFEKDDSLTLFVQNLSGVLVGTVTDGDIRRGLIIGYSVEDEVGRLAHRQFSFLISSNFDVRQVNAAKEKGIELLPIVDDNMRIVDVVNFKKQKSYLPIDAVLMAGGKGERLRPLTDKVPKPLLPIQGKPIIDLIVRHIISYGVKNISVTVNYLKEQIEDHFSEPIDDIVVKTIREPQFLGTIGSIKFVCNFRNDIVLVMNSDAITDINLESFYLHFLDNNADMSIAAIPYSVSIPYGVLELNDTDVIGLLEKPSYNYYANAGIYLIRRKLLELIPADCCYNATDFINLLIKNKYKVVRFPLNGTWIDIGNMQEYQKAIEIVRCVK